ncbi:MAG: ABC transporter substrate-binding protein [Negativibacillus sp.]
MKWKRLMALLMAAVMTLSFAACSSNESKNETNNKQQETAAAESTAAEENKAEAEPAEKITIQIAALKGPTALGMLNLMENDANGISVNDYEFTLAGAADEIVGKISSGELDIAAVPTNVGATLYNKTEGGVQLAALNTLGVLYILENGDSIHSVEDLAGKTIVATGQGSTPEYALNMILEKNGLTDVTVEYKSEHSEVPPMLLNGEASVAMLPQPFVTSVLSQNENIRVALDVTEEWNKAVNGESELTMGCVIVRKDFAEEQKEALDAFLDEYKASVDAVVADPAAAAALSEKYDIIKAAVAEKAIPECNIVFIEGNEMERIAGGCLQVLFDANPKSVGGSLPDEAFYYKR